MRTVREHSQRPERDENVLDKVEEEQMRTVREDSQRPERDESVLDKVGGIMEQVEAVEHRPCRSTTGDFFEMAEEYERLFADTKEWGNEMWDDDDDNVPTPYTGDFEM